MKVKRYLPILLSVTASTFVLSGCSDFNNGFDAKNYEYKQSFADMFGNPDPNQTWSTVSRSTLDVSIDMPNNYNDCTIKVYTANPRGEVKNSYLLGEWKATNGSSSKFTFDMPSDLKTAWVAIVNKDGGRIVKEANIKDNNCKAEFRLNGYSTRSASTGSYSESDTWTGFPLNKYYNPAYDTDNTETPGFIQIYPENKLDYSRGLCTDFEFVATGEPITFTHFYACTGGNDKLYYFTYDPASETLEQAYADYTHHVALCEGAAAHTQAYVGSSGLSSYGNNGWKSISDGSIDGGIKDGKIIDAPATWNDGYTDHDNENIGSAFRGKTFTITGCTPGEHIVFYLVNGTTPTHTAGSDDIAATRSAINKPFYQSSTGKTLNPQLAGVLTVGGVTYLGFEDALSWGGHTVNPNEYYDLNDIVFTVTGGYTIEDHEDKIDQAMSYIIAYEDLGGSFDFDFNDIVLKATHVAGRNTATLSVLAAGGTLPVSISYDGQAICSDVHAEFGQSTKTVINALPGKHKEYGTRSFTITGIDDSTNPFYLSKISITVSRSDGEISTIHSPQYYTSSIPDEAHKVGADEDTSIPYAILIANPEWDWCDENISIATVDGFIDWVQDANKVAWYEDGNMWGKANNVPSNENVISGSTVYQKIEASQFADCSYGATVTMTISDFSANGDLSFFTKYKGLENWNSDSKALESQPSYSVTSSTSTTVTLELSAGCEAFNDGLFIVYDNTKFKVSAISVTPAEAPNYGEEITLTYDGSNTYGYKILLSDITTKLQNLSDDDVIMLTYTKAAETTSSCGNIIGGMNGYYAYQCTTLTPSDKIDNTDIIQVKFNYGTIKGYDFITVPLQSYNGGTVGKHLTNVYVK